MRAVLGADVKDLGLPVLLERRGVRRERVGRGDALAHAHLVQDRDGNLLGQRRGLPRAARPSRIPRPSAECHDAHHEDDHQDARDGADGDPAPSLLLGPRGSLSSLARGPSRLGTGSRGGTVLGGRSGHGHPEPTSAPPIHRDLPACGQGTLGPAGVMIGA